MLSERDQRLLTASVDGVLTHAQSAELGRLLSQSPEARRLHGRLHADAARLRRLPRVAAPVDFAAAFLADAPAGPVVRRPRVAPARSSRWPLWASVCAAASVFIAVGAASLLYTASSPDAGGTAAPVARAPHKQPAPAPERRTGPTPAEPTPARPPAEQDPPREVPVEPPPPSDPPVSPRVEVTPPLGSPVLTGSDAALFEEVTVRLALIMNLRELEQPGPRAKLVAELKKDDSQRLELFCRDSLKALDRVQAALAGQGGRVLTDAYVQARAKQKLPTDFVIYAEHLTATEIGELLDGLAAEDRKAGQKRSSDELFDKFVLTPMKADDRKDLARLLGVDLGQLRAAPVRATPDPRRPVQDGTASQVVGSLTSQGGKPVVVLAFKPTRPPGLASKEVRDFLDARGPAKAGAVKLLLVLRARE